MGIAPSHIRGKTFHRRKGEVENAFTYGLDYVLIDPDYDGAEPFLFSRNKFNLISLFDRDHGGVRGNGEGVSWARKTLVENGLERYSDYKIMLLAQPRFLGHVFNPVCFWLVFDKEENLLIAIAEVNNTFGERHSYVCHHADLRPIEKDDRLTAQKIFHVSPFQPVRGQYFFRFHFSPEKVGVWIDYKTENEGVFATFTGRKNRATSFGFLCSAVTRPFWSLRVIALIHWQAVKLKLKGALFRSKPLPPATEVSQ